MLVIAAAMTMAVSVSFSIIAFPKIFDFWGFKSTCGAIFFPIGYTLSDAIGFFHGKKIARFSFTCAIILDICFSLGGILLFYIPGTPNKELEEIYSYLFLRHGIYLSLFAALGVYISQRLNLFLFFSNKVEKFPFPLRSSLSSFPADILVAFFALVPAFWGENSILTDLEFALNSAIVKCIMSVIYSFIVYTIILYFKDSEPNSVR